MKVQGDVDVPASDVVEVDDDLGEGGLYFLFVSEVLLVLRSSTGSGLSLGTLLGGGLRGLAQHAVKRWAQALEVVPRTLAENALGGAEGNEVVSRLWAKHEGPGGEVYGVDVEVSA